MQTAMLVQPRAMCCEACFQNSASLNDLRRDRSKLDMRTLRLSRQASKMQGASISQQHACYRHNGVLPVLMSAAGGGESHLKGIETSSAAAERHTGAHVGAQSLPIDIRHSTLLQNASAAQIPAEADQTAGFSEEGLHHLPIMPLTKVKLPQETISLQLFEPRYRLMFKLVKQASSRRFGLVMADQQQGTMDSVGSLCELTHYIPVPER